MQKLLLSILLTMLAGCSRSPIEQPRANGAYLVIDGVQAWAVLIADGKRLEEPGKLLMTGRSGTTNSYIVETEHCGRLVWLKDDRQEATDFILTAIDRGELPGCPLKPAQTERAWVALDYSDQPAISDYRYAYHR